MVRAAGYLLARARKRGQEASDRHPMCGIRLIRAYKQA